MELFDTKYWIVKLDKNQYYLGRCVVILKRNCKELSKVTKEEFLDLHGIIKKLEENFKNKFGATMFNWTCLMNNAYKETNNEVPQVHLHFRPRYKTSLKIGEELFNDENFTHHYEKEKEKIVSEEILEKIRERFLS